MEQVQLAGAGGAVPAVPRHPGAVRRGDSESGDRVHGDADPPRTEHRRATAPQHAVVCFATGRSVALPLAN